LLLKAPAAESFSVRDSVVARLASIFNQRLTEAMAIGDSVKATLLRLDRSLLGERVGVSDDVLARLVAALKQPLSDTTSIADRVATTLLSQIHKSLSDAARIGDNVAAKVIPAIHSLQVEAVAISDRVSATKMSISGLPNVQVVTDNSGNTIIKGTDSSGGLISQVSLPPGTTMGPTVSFAYTSSGLNSMTQLSGFAPPYPPGKVVTILNDVKATNVCLVDSATGASLQTQVCGATDLSASHVALPCDGSPHTYGPFPAAPLSRVYTCAQTTLGGHSYMQVSGLAFSTIIVDGTPPTLVLPSDITTVLTSKMGAAVTFSVSATDLLDPHPAVSCSMNSGVVFPVGTTTVVCTAVDAAGNKATGSFHVSVVYKFGGFLPPLQSDGSYNLGRTIPVKFQLTDANGKLVSFASAKISAGGVTGTFEFQGDHYQFNLDTKGMQAGPLTIAVSLDDGTAYTIQIHLTS